MHTSGQRNQETVKFLSGPCTAEWAIDCFLYSPPSFFLNTAINFLSCLTNSFSLLSLSPPQLSLLQKRMHKALVKYFKQRSLYSQAELDRCQALSQDTNQKIKTAQVFVRICVKQDAKLSPSISILNAFIQLFIPVSVFFWMETYSSRIAQ